MGFVKRHFSLAVLVTLVVTLAAYVARRAFQEERDRAMQTQSSNSKGVSHGQRSPASIEKVFDYSYLSGVELISASKSRIARSISIDTSTHQSADIEVGNFVLLDENSQKDFACGYYDNVTLTFEAEGVAVSGEKPTLVINAGCQVGANINAMSPIKLPLDKLRAEKPGNADYKFYGESGAVSVSSINPPPDWPKNWVLSEVKLSNSQNSSRTLKISQDELRQANSKPIFMKW